MLKLIVFKIVMADISDSTMQAAAHHSSSSETLSNPWRVPALPANGDIVIEALKACIRGRNFMGNRHALSGLFLELNIQDSDTTVLPIDDVWKDTVERFLTAAKFDYELFKSAMDVPNFSAHDTNTQGKVKRRVTQVIKLVKELNKFLTQYSEYTVQRASPDMPSEINILGSLITQTKELQDFIAPPPPPATFNSNAVGASVEVSNGSSVLTLTRGRVISAVNRDDESEINIFDKLLGVTSADIDILGSKGFKLTEAYLYARRVLHVPDRIYFTFPTNDDNTWKNWKVVDCTARPCKLGPCFCSFRHRNQHFTDDQAVYAWLIKEFFRHTICNYGSFCTNLQCEKHKKRYSHIRQAELASMIETMIPHITVSDESFSARADCMAVLESFKVYTDDSLRVPVSRASGGPSSTVRVSDSSAFGGYDSDDREVFNPFGVLAISDDSELRDPAFGGSASDGPAPGVSAPGAPEYTWADLME